LKRRSLSPRHARSGVAIQDPSVMAGIVIIAVVTKVNGGIATAAHAGVDTSAAPMRAAIDLAKTVGRRNRAIVVNVSGPQRGRLPSRKWSHSRPRQYKLQGRSSRISLDLKDRHKDKDRKGRKGLRKLPPMALVVSAQVDRAAAVVGVVAGVVAAVTRHRVP
jgi:hypothetical protein